MATDNEFTFIDTTRPYYIGPGEAREVMEAAVDFEQSPEYRFVQFSTLRLLQALYWATFYAGAGMSELFLKTTTFGQEGADAIVSKAIEVVAEEINRRATPISPEGI